MVNDVSIIAVLVSVFILVGIMAPIVNDAFSNSRTEMNTSVFESGIADTLEEGDDTGASGLDFLLSVTGMFFWTFGVLPFWLDAVFLIMRAVFWFLVARNVWVGGGG